MSPHPSDRHQHKRAYQPQITSFFSRPLPDNASPAPESVPSSLLAPAIQASLLSVGMRIRKAVPEGYKTHKTKLLDDTAIISSYPMHGHGYDEDKENEGRSRPRELQPLCGIHKVGGLAVQESTFRAVNGHSLVRSPSALGSSFVSSQDSNASVQGPEGVGHQHMALRTKRRFDDDGSDADDEDNFAFDLDCSPELMPTSFPGRSFAKPRSRRRTAQSQANVSSIDHGDFEEAAFLQPWGGEIQMGGL